MFYFWVCKHQLVIVLNLLHLDLKGGNLGATAQFLVPKLLNGFVDAWIGSHVEGDKTLGSAQGGHHVEKEQFAQACVGKVDVLDLRVVPD